MVAGLITFGSAGPRAAAPQEAIVHAGVPLAPEVIRRHPDGRVMVRAIRLTEPLRVDGRLDEEVYRREASFGDFIQTLPREGAPATERISDSLLPDLPQLDSRAADSRSRADQDGGSECACR